jgi:glutamine amidotransferase
LSFIVVDYSKGNLRSVQKGLELAGGTARISGSEADIRSARAIVLPGVGSFADASRAMLNSGQTQAIRERIAAGVPFLGVCLGLQLLYERGSEGMKEGEWAEGLGILKGSCRRVASVDGAGRSYKVPHVGWNQVNMKSALSSALFAGIEDGSHFYFTHSYQCEPTDGSEVLATSTHAEDIVCAVQKGRVFAVQFHPEKSSHKGLALMRNFVRLVQENNWQ